MYRSIRGGKEILAVRATLEGEKAGEVVMEIQKQGGVLVMKGINVERQFRGKGIGSMMINLAEETALANDLKRVLLRPYTHDESPHALQDLRDWYARRGYLSTNDWMFKEIARRAHNYSGDVYRIAEG